VIAGMTDWILSLHGSVAIAIVFLLTALEASAFVGFVFPGEIAVVLGGVLASQHRDPLAAMIVAAVAGAIIGDTIGYAVGRRWGHQILRGAGKHVPFIRHRIDEHLASAGAFLQRRGGQAVFFGRFTAALRVMVPGLAGMAELPYGQFLLWNAIGGFVWGTGFVLLGFIAGNAWERVAGDASKVGLALLVLLFLAVVLGRVLRNVREHGEALPDRLARLAPVAWTRGRLPRTSAWLAARVDTRSASGFVLSVVVLAGVICDWVFATLTQDVMAHEEAVSSDPRVMQFVVDHRTDWATAFMKIVTWLGSNAVLIPVVVIVCLVLLRRHRGWRTLAVPVAAIVGANLWCQVVKPLVDRARPPDVLHLIEVSGPAFPSGHATAAVAVWVAAAIVLTARAPWRLRAAAGAGAAVVVVLVALSQVYLGVQWWTDVAAGLALGGAWVCLLVAGLLLSVRLPARRPISDHSEPALDPA
jgi:undecaprenyl-diphosphatase